MNEGKRVRRVYDQIEEYEKECEKEYTITIGVVRLSVLNLCVLEVSKLAVDRCPIRGLEELALEGLGNLSFDLRKDNDC